MKMTRADIEFNVDKKPVKFVVMHNIPDHFGMSLDDALTNWLYRTKEYTAKSFCAYVRSKQTGFIILTEEEYNEATANKKML